MKSQAGREGFGWLVRGTALLATVASVAACDSNTVSKSAIRSKLASGCEQAGGSTSYCECYAAKAAPHVTLSSAGAIDREVRSGHPPQWFLAARSQCQNVQ